DVDQRRNRPVGEEDYYNNADRWAARLIGLWQATERLSLTLTYETFSDQGAGDLQFVDCEQAKGTPFECTHDLRWAQVNVPGRKDLRIDDARFKLTYDLGDTQVLDYRFSRQDQERSQITDIDAGNHAGTVWGSFGT